MQTIPSRFPEKDYHNVAQEHPATVRFVAHSEPPCIQTISIEISKIERNKSPSILPPIMAHTLLI
jgi:hypothetical protein